MSNYDVWKLQTPEEYYRLSDECDECGCSAKECRQLGDIWVCENCYEEERREFLEEIHERIKKCSAEIVEKLRERELNENEESSKSKL